jgi:hypothetical protein
MNIRGTVWIYKLQLAVEFNSRHLWVTSEKRQLKAVITISSCLDTASLINYNKIPSVILIIIFIRA